MNKTFLCFVLLGLMAVVGCDSDLPDDIESKVTAPVVYPEALTAENDALTLVAKEAMDINAVLQTANASSIPQANALAEELSGILALFDQVRYVSRVPANAVITEEPLPGTSPAGGVIVYSYSLTTFRDGAEQTTYINYQIEQQESGFKHQLFSGPSPDPSTQTVVATIPPAGTSGEMTLNFGEEAKVMWMMNDQNALVYTIDQASMVRSYQINADNSVTLVEMADGVAVSEATWSPAGYGIFNGSIYIENYKNINLWNAIQPAKTVADKADQMQKDVMYQGLINRLQTIQPYFDFPGTAAISTGDVNGNAATVISWDDNGTSRQKKFYIDETSRNYEIWENGQLLYTATEALDESNASLIGQPGVATTDGFWDHQLEVHYNALGSGQHRYIVAVPHPNSWTGQAIGRFYTFSYNEADIVGTFVDQHANKADFEAGTPWGNAYWHNSTWTANGTTGSYTHKNVFDWPGNTQVSGSW